MPSSSSIIDSLRDAVLKVSSFSQKEIESFLFDRRNLTVVETDSESLYLCFDTSRPRSVVTRYRTESNLLPSDCYDLDPGTLRYDILLNCLDISVKKESAYRSLLLSRHSSLRTPEVSLTRQTLALVLEDFKTRTEELASLGWTPLLLGRFRYGELFIFMQTILGDSLDGRYVTLSSQIEDDSLYPLSSTDYATRDSLFHLFGKRLSLGLVTRLPPETRELLVTTRHMEIHS